MCNRRIITFFRKILSSNATIMKIKTSILAILLLVGFVGFSQNSQIKKATVAFNNGQYFEAAQEASTAYERINPKTPKARGQKAEMAYYSGYSYERIFNNDAAEDWYQRSIDLLYYKKQPEVYFRIASIQREKGKYEEAKENYQEYLALVPGEKRAEMALEAMNDAIVLKDNRTRYTVKNESKINTPGMEMSPTIADRRGNLIVFGSTRKAETTSGKDPIIGEPYFNVWQVEFDRKGNWTEPVLFEADSVNTEYNEGTMAMDGRFRKVYITRCPNEEKQILGCQIWVSERRGRDFGIPTRVPIQPHDSISVGHPCPTEDGNGIIFASDLPGGQGGMDLWFTEYDRRSDSWSDPVNLGDKINTPGNELFPTFALNGDLLFSSDGHKGLGGLDLFRAEKMGEGLDFGAPVNLGTPLNSDVDDFHLTETSPKTGFFTSNRDGSQGTKNMTDIWSYELPPNLFDLKVIVNEVGSPNRIEGVTVEVTTEDDSFKGVTNSEGVVFWDKKVDGDRFINEERSYTVKLLPMEGYHESTDIEEFSTVGLEYDQNFIIEMPLLPKTPIVLPEVRYDLDKAVLQIIDGVINSKDSLNYVYDLLEEYPGMKLRLMSHTDARGSAAYNRNLAQRRAQACVDYLVGERGVNPDRLVATGRGEDEPRTIYKIGDEYTAFKPKRDDVVYEEVILTEEHINQYKKSDPEMFERLHQYNRRTEAEVIRMDWSPEDPGGE